MPPLDIQSRDLDLVQAILAQHVPDREVWVFGSRLTGTTKVFSDLDLAIMGEEPLPISVLSNLMEAFSESDLPFKVDVVDWAVTSPSFRKIIEQNHGVLRRRT